MAIIIFERPYQPIISVMGCQHILNLTRTYLFNCDTEGGQCDLGALILIHLEGEFSVWKQDWGDQGPDVDSCTEPGRDNLNPDRTHVSRNRFNRDVIPWRVPEKAKSKLL